MEEGNAPPVLPILLTFFQSVMIAHLSSYLRPLTKCYIHSSVIADQYAE